MYFRSSNLPLTGIRWIDFDFLKNEYCKHKSNSENLTDRWEENTTYFLKNNKTQGWVKSELLKAFF